MTEAKDTDWVCTLLRYVFWIQALDFRVPTLNPKRRNISIPMYTTFGCAHDRLLWKDMTGVVIVHTVTLQMVTDELQSIAQ